MSENIFIETFYLYLYLLYILWLQVAVSKTKCRLPARYPRCKAYQ